MAKSTLIVSKTFDFHAAHHLPNHQGQCRNVHGHTYRLEVQVIGTPKDVTGDSDDGMVVDFGLVKELYKHHLEPFLEHRDLNDTLVKTGAVEVSTCEEVSVWIARMLKTLLDERLTEDQRRRHVRIYKVLLWETPTSYAEVMV